MPASLLSGLYKDAEPARVTWTDPDTLRGEEQNTLTVRIDAEKTSPRGKDEVVCQPPGDGQAPSTMEVLKYAERSPHTEERKNVYSKLIEDHEKILKALANKGESRDSLLHFLSDPHTILALDRITKPDRQGLVLPVPCLGQQSGPASPNVQQHQRQSTPWQTLPRSLQPSEADPEAIPIDDFEPMVRINQISRISSRPVARRLSCRMSILEARTVGRSGSSGCILLSCLSTNTLSRTIPPRSSLLRSS